LIHFQFAKTRPPKCDLTLCSIIRGLSWFGPTIECGLRLWSQLLHCTNSHQEASVVLRARRRNPLLILVRECDNEGLCHLWDLACRWGRLCTSEASACHAPRIICMIVQWEGAEWVKKSPGLGQHSPVCFLARICRDHSEYQTVHLPYLWCWPAAWRRNLTSVTIAKVSCSQYLRRPLRISSLRFIAVSGEMAST